jgi:SARP family transcriptional regulator, regulator of embCAB operon
VKFRLLGPLSVIAGNTVITPATPRLRTLLALLLLRNGETIPGEEMLEELWGSERPANRAVLHTYVYQLRKLYGPRFELCTGADAGFAARVGRHELDVAEFDALVDRGRQALSRGEMRLAATDLRRAVAMSRGTPLANVARGPLLTALVSGLEARMQTARRLADHAFASRA